MKKLINAVKGTRGIGKRKILNVSNIKKDFNDPDLESYGDKLPVGNKAVMKAGLAKTKVINYLK